MVDGKEAWLCTPFPADLNGPTDQPFTPLPPDAPEKPIIVLFERACTRAPQAAALGDGTLRLSAAETMDRVRRLACAVMESVPEGGVVAVALAVDVLLP